MGKLIVLEGLDGSGKATQTKLLYETLRKSGENVMQITFPNYDSDSSALVKMYLGGAFGDAPGDVNAYAASSFYSVDRYASYKTIWGDFYGKGGTVISDRYTTSNAVHQCSKLAQSEWDAYLTWLFDFEYARIGIPKPDLVIYLDVATDVSQQLMSTRYHGDETKKDIHEKDIAYLQKSRQAAQYCAEKLDWTRVCCSENGAMRSIEAIHTDVYNAVKQKCFTAIK
ncbi:MAG: deoxynucleoside kinase [Ruthenibacterium sp.]